MSRFVVQPSEPFRGDTCYVVIMSQVSQVKFYEAIREKMTPQSPQVMKIKNKLWFILKNSKPL